MYGLILDTYFDSVAYIFSVINSVSRETIILGKEHVLSSIRLEQQMYQWFMFKLRLLKKLSRYSIQAKIEFVLIRCKHIGIQLFIGEIIE